MRVHPLGSATTTTTAMTPIHHACENPTATNTPAVPFKHHDQTVFVNVVDESVVGRRLSPCSQRKVRLDGLS